MSWAYLLLKHTPSVVPHIAALNLLKNKYQDPKFVFWPNPRYKFPLLWINRLFPTPINLVFRKLKVYDALLYRYAKYQKISILHAHFGNIGADYFSLGSKLSLPFAVSFYGIDYQRMLQAKPRYRDRYQAMFLKADAFICEGPYGAQRLERMGCPQGKIYVIHLGVEIGKIPFYPRIKIAGHLKMIQVASFEGRKGYIDSVRAFAAALPQCPGLSLDLYGPPSDLQVYTTIQESITKLGLGNYIRILPPVSYDQLHLLLREYELILQPSKHQPNGDSEGGAPIVLLDAQATGMPVIATQHCDIPNEVIHNKTGLLAPEGDSRMLAKHIERFYNMGDLEYQSFSKTARLHVEKHFDAAKCGHQMSKLYQHLVDTHLCSSSTSHE